MNTVQKYTGKGNNVPPAPQAAQNTGLASSMADNRQPAPILSVAEFIQEHSYLINLLPDELDDQLRELLIDHRVGYNNPQDGIALLHGLLPQLATSPDAHYALLLRGETIVGLVCVNLNDHLPQAESAAYLALDDIDSRYLISRLAEVGATGLLLVSIQNGHRPPLEPIERAYVQKLLQSMELMSVDLVDWQLIIDGQSVSCLVSTDVTAASPISAEEFITQHADLMGLPPAELAPQLTQRLQAQSVHYATVLDGIALLRAFTPKVAAYPETHYGLLLQGDVIVGFIWLAAYTDRLDEEESVLVCYESETRPLMRKALELEADRLLLVSTRHTNEHDINSLEIQEIARLSSGLEVFGVELLDYLLFFDDLNVSYAYWSHGERGLDDGVTKSELDRHYLDFPSAITFSPAH